MVVISLQVFNTLWELISAESETKRTPNEITLEFAVTRELKNIQTAAKSL
jgi:hypothetical protein